MGFFLRLLICYQGYNAESKTVEKLSVAISGRLTDFFHKMTGLLEHFSGYLCLGRLNQTVVRYKQPFECSRRFLAALVKEMMAPFPCPNHG